MAKAHSRGTKGQGRLPRSRQVVGLKATATDRNACHNLVTERLSTSGLAKRATGRTLGGQSSLLLVEP